MQLTYARVVKVAKSSLKKKTVIRDAIRDSSVQRVFQEKPPTRASEHIWKFKQVQGHLVISNQSLFSFK